MSSNAMLALRKVALKLAGVEEGVACEGTVLEKRTVKVGKKAFLFLGAKDAMLKLEKSLELAKKLASRDPSRYRVGANGWVKIVFSDADPPPMDVMTKWIAESHGLAGPPAPSAPKKTAPAR